jgi:hypothetical protein
MQDGAVKSLDLNVPPDQYRNRKKNVKLLDLDIPPDKYRAKRISDHKPSVAENENNVFLGDPLTADSQLIQDKLGFSEGAKKTIYDIARQDIQPEDISRRNVLGDLSQRVINPGETITFPEMTISGDRSTARPLSEIPLTDTQRKIGMNIPVPSIKDAYSEERERLNNVLGTIQSFTTKPIENVVAPIKSGTSRIIEGFNTPPSSSASALRGLGKIVSGGLETGIGLLPPVMALNAIQPAISSSARKIGESIGADPDVAEDIANKITPFVFGLPVGIGSLTSEEAVKAIDKSGALNDLEEGDKKLALDLVGNGLFFGIAGFGGKGIEKGKEFVKGKAEQAATKIVKPIVKEPTPDITETNLTKEGIEYFKHRLDDPALSPNEKQITLDYLTKQGLSPEELKYNSKTPSQTKGVIPEDLQNRIIPDAEKQTSDLPSLEEVKSPSRKDDRGSIVPEGLTVEGLNSNKNNLFPQVHEAIKQKAIKAGITDKNDLQDIIDETEIEFFDNVDENWDTKVDDVINKVVGYYKEGKGEKPTSNIVGANTGKGIKMKLPNGEEKIFVMDKGSHQEPMTMAFRYIVDDMVSKGEDEKKAMEDAGEFITQAAVNDKMDIGDVTNGEFKSTWNRGTTNKYTPAQYLSEVPTPEAIQRARTILGDKFEEKSRAFINEPNNLARLKEAKDKTFEIGLLLEDFARKTSAADLLGEKNINADLIGKITAKEKSLGNKAAIKRMLSEEEEKIQSGKAEGIKQQIIPEAGQQTSDLPSLEEMQNVKQKEVQAPGKIGGNETAIQRMLSENKSPEDISKALKIPVEQVNQFVDIDKTIELPEFTSSQEAIKYSRANPGKTELIKKRIDELDTQFKEAVKNEDFDAAQQIAFKKQLDQEAIEYRDKPTMAESEILRTSEKEVTPVTDKAPNVAGPLNVKNDVTLNLRGIKDLSSDTKSLIAENDKLLSQLFRQREIQRAKDSTPNEKRGAFKKANEIVKTLRQNGIKASYESRNVYVDGKKIVPFEGALPVKVGDVKIENSEAKTSFKKLSTDEVDKQTYLADVLSQKKFLPDDLRNMLPKGFGQSKIDKAVSDIKEDAGAEQSKEAQILRDFAKEVENRFNTTGYIEFSNGQRYIKEQFDSDLEDYATRKGLQTGEGDPSFGFGDKDQVLFQELDFGEGRNDLQKLQDRKRHLQLVMDNPKSAGSTITQAKRELIDVNKKLTKLKNKESQSDFFGDIQNQEELFQEEHARVRTVYDKMSVKEQQKFLEELAKGGAKEVSQGDLSKEQATAFTKLLQASVTYDPKTADITTALEESLHNSTIALAKPYMAKNLLRENGWNGKGEIWDVDGNKTLRAAHEKLAAKYIEWRTKQEKNSTEPKTRLEKFFQYLRELWAKIASYLNRIGFSTQSGYFYDLATGGLRKNAEKANYEKLNEEFGLKPTETLGQSFSPVWYSKLEKVISDKAPNKNINPISLIAMLKNNGVKNEEIKWLDVEGYLKENPRTTKQQLIDYVKDNQIQIEEVTKGQYKTDSELIEIEPDGEDNYTVRVDGQIVEEHIVTKREAEKIAERERENSEIPKDETKFSQWKTRGGSNYREVLFTLPNKNYEKLNNEYESLMNKRESLKRGSDERENINRRLEEIAAQMEQMNKGQFKSSHWDEPNVLAHVRLQDFTDTEGRKILLVDEVQSDWHEKGRKKGYKIGLPEGYKLREVNGKYGIWSEKANTWLYQPVSSDKEAVLKSFNDIESLGRVPDAPFKTTWHELVLKRVLRMAAEEGYDGIAITTGGQQADRYDLSKQVDKISVIKNQDGTYQIQPYKNNEPVAGRGGVAPSEVEDFVGKDLAKKIIEQTEKEKDYSGMNLKAGGEGMEGFYDKMLPSFLNNYAKKWGAKVGETEIANMDKEEGSYDLKKLHFLPVTDAMRRSVLFEGQSLFQKLPAERIKESLEEKGREIFGSGKTRYAEWAKEMRKEFGEDPDYKRIYLKSRESKLPNISEKDMGKVIEKKQSKETSKDERAIGLNKEEIENYRKELDLDKLDAPKRKSVLRSLDEAKERNLKNSALEIADEIIRTKRIVDDAEHAGMVMKAKDLRDEYNSLTKKASEAIDKGDTNSFKGIDARRESILEQLDKLTMASDLGGTELGRALNIRKMRVKGEGYDLASVMQRAKSVKGNRLTEEETRKIEELTKKYEESEKELEKLKEDYDKVLAEKEKLSAQRIIERESKKSTIREKAATSRERILKERTDIKKQLSSLGFRLNDVTGLTAEGSYWVGKLAINYIKEGAVNLGEVVQKVMVDLPEITERDVWRALNSRDPNRQSKLRTEAQKRISTMKTQAKLLEEIKNAEQGIFKEPGEKPSSTYEIYKLRKLLTSLRSEAFRSELESKRLEKALQTINDLQDQLKNQYRNAKKRKPIDTPEIQSIKEKIKELRKTMNVEDVLADLQDQLRTGEFKIKEKVEVKPLPPELERKVIEVNVLRRKIRNAVREMKPTTSKDIGIEIVNTLRTAKASLDMSAALRQGFFPSIRRPGLFVESQRQAVKSFLSENSYEQIQNNIESHPNHYLRIKSKLELTEIDAAPNKKEEMFQSNVLEKIPIYGEGIKASNRHMVTTLNLLRVGIFDEFVEKYPNATQEELTAWANYINVATGRGNLGKFSHAANVLSLGLYSPRFAVSRIQTPFMLFKHWSRPRVRKEIAKDYAAFGAMGASVLALAVLAGFEVGSDPDDPDFGKVVIDNTRVDIFAGIQQPMRLLLRIGKVGTNRIGLTEKAGREENPLEMLGRFSSYKLAPAITVPLELLTGKSLIGEERTVTETMLKSVVPMVYEDVYDAYMDGGITKAAWTGGLNFFGMSVNTYEKKAKTLLEKAGLSDSKEIKSIKEKENVIKDLRQQVIDGEIDQGKYLEALGELEDMRDDSADWQEYKDYKNEESWRVKELLGTD